MSQPAPGKHWRKGITLAEVFRMFPDDRTAEDWLVRTRWPDGPVCPHCGSGNVRAVKNRKPMPFRCRECRKHFSVRSGTVLADTKLGYQAWVIGFYLMSTGIKGTSSMKLHRDLGVTQRTAWHLAHRIRETWGDNDGGPFAGPVEADETFIGGRESNKHHDKKLRAGRGAVGKAVVAGVKDRETGRVRARVVPRANAEHLIGHVQDSAEAGTMVYTDEAKAYHRLPNHEAVHHGVGKYVEGQAHTNGLESFWSLMKRGYHGTYHRMSPKHLHRYVAEFQGRYNDRPLDTLAQMRRMVRGAVDRRVKYRDLVARNGIQGMAE